VHVCGGGGVEVLLEDCLVVVEGFAGGAFQAVAEDWADGYGLMCMCEYGRNGVGCGDGGFGKNVWKPKVFFFLFFFDGSLPGFVGLLTLDSHDLISSIKSKFPFLTSKSP